MKQRLDEAMVGRGVVQSRSHAARLIKMELVSVDGKIVTKSGQVVDSSSMIVLKNNEDYVSRSGYKLAGANEKFKVDFRGKVVLDVGSSTGGFTDYSLRHGAKKVIAVDVGTDQLHSSLHGDARIELHEKTDIRDVELQRVKSHESRAKEGSDSKNVYIAKMIDIIVVDVSFVSLRNILPHVSCLMTHDSILVAMLKPQFEAGKEQINKGIIKNDKMRRDILKDFEIWVRQHFIILDKADSEVAGVKGNVERFYLLKRL